MILQEIPEKVKAFTKSGILRREADRMTQRLNSVVGLVMYVSRLGPQH